MAPLDKMSKNFDLLQAHVDNLLNYPVSLDHHNSCMYAHEVVKPAGKETQEQQTKLLMELIESPRL